MIAFHGTKAFVCLLTYLTLGSADLSSSYGQTTLDNSSSTAQLINGSMTVASASTNTISHPPSIITSALEQSSTSTQPRTSTVAPPSTSPAIKATVVSTHSSTASPVATPKLNASSTATTIQPTLTQKSSTISPAVTFSPTQPTETNTFSTKGSSPTKSEDSGLEGGLIAVGIFALIALIIAVTFIFLYLRSSHGCYEMLRRSPSRPEDSTMTAVHVLEQSPIRERITSFSSIKIKLHVCKSDPFSIKSFQSHVKRLHRDSDYLFSQEYEALGKEKYLSENDKKIELVYTAGQKPENKPKNRYADILPYDHNRVILTEIDGDPNSSYINASYIDSYSKQNAYIAAQGPNAATVADFWRMIWENNSRVIVMITNLFERCKPKCDKYWPDTGSENYGFFHVAMMKEETFANYVVRTLRVEAGQDQDHYISVNNEHESRVIQQFHFTEWPDHDVPAHAPSILRFIHKSKAANPKDAGPIIVHCSAGVGRSGTYIVIDSTMQRIDDSKTVDIFNFLNHIRTQRNFLVQEESQYIFVHDAINDYTHFGDSNISIENFPNHLNTLRRVSAESKSTSMRKEFEAIDNTKTPEKHKWVAKKNCNTLKNRRKDVLPVERTRVKLPPVLGIEGGDYINASYIDGFSKKKEYIATQAPMRNTAESFWRMVKSTKCNMIVMLLNEDEWKKDDYFADLPTNEEAVSCGKQEIQLESEDIVDDVVVRKLRVFSSDVSDGKSVNHYHYRNWPTDGIPEDKASLIRFIELIRNRKKTEAKNAPIIVNCDYGVGRTGIFCLLSTMWDQLEEEGSIDVYQTAKLFRTQRPQFIETELQYSLCYDILEKLVTRRLSAISTRLPQNNGNINTAVSSNSINYEELPAQPDTARKEQPHSPDHASEDTPNSPDSERPDSLDSKTVGVGSTGSSSCNDSPDNETPLIKTTSTSGTDNPRYRKNSLPDTADTVC